MAKRFDKIHIEISNICNLKCPFCPEVFRPLKRMEPETFKSIVKQAAPLTEQICLHLLGEPLAHPELELILDHAQEAGARIYFVTNGTLLREKQHSLLLHHPALRQVNFSLHSFLANSASADPETYLSRIFAWTQEALRKRPELYINFRLWNQASTQELAERNQDFLRRIETEFKVDLSLSLNLKRKKSHPIQGRLYLHLDTEFVWPSLKSPVIGSTGTCYGLSSHFGILADGTVVPCCLDHEGATPLGNAKEEALETILESPRARVIFDGFQNHKLIEALCQRCSYIQRFSRLQPQSRSSHSGESRSG